MVPNFNLFYYVEEYKWDYDEVPLSRKARLSEMISDMMNQIENKQLTAQDKKERRVLLQAILVCLLTILTLIGFFLIPSIVANRWANFVSNCLWLGCAGNNAIIYIIMNSTINQKFKKLVFQGKNVFVDKVVPSKVLTIVQHYSTFSTKNKDTQEKNDQLRNKEATANM
uniref:Uncharacterized protein n=1 Tax=Romanomermis culicivorax TaxID=13658 RepID=A0A915IT42_ROMCU